MKRTFVMATLLINACGTSNSKQAESFSQDQNEEVISSSNTVVELDASSEDEWIYLDLDKEGTLVAFEDSWDLAFKRYQIKLNPVSVPPTAAAILEDTDLSSVLEAPAQDQFKVDTVTENLEDGLVFNGENPWYDYDFKSHTLSPKDSRVYVVYTASHGLFAIKMLGYYDEFGTPASIKFEFKKF